MNPLLALLIGLALTADVAHADRIVLRADPDPVVDVTINGRPARLLVDLILPDVIVLDPGAATRLGVQPAPLVAARVVLDDASVKARVARPAVRFANGRTSRAFAGLFGARWADMPGIDGAVGPGVLPYDEVHVVLDDAPGGAVRSFALKTPDVWAFDADLVGEPARASFNLRRSTSLLNRAAATHVSEAGQFTPAGEVKPTPFFLSLATTTQPGRATLSVAGFALGDVLARTAAPLAGPSDVDVIVVRPDAGRAPTRTIEIGRAALAVCHEIVASRPRKTLSVRCG